MKKLISSALFCCALVLSTACNKTAFIPAYNPTDSLDQQLADIHKNGQLPGFAVAIVKADKILFEQTFGYADIASQTPYTNTTQQNIASLSKTFIGIALMKAIEQQKLTLDMPLNDLLPFSIQNPYHPNVPITIRHLATHTSSINDGGFEYRSVFLNEPFDLHKKDIGKENYHFFKEWEKNERSPLADFLPAALSSTGNLYNKKIFLKVAPGSQYQYSNLGASLLAYAIGLVVNQPFEKYVSEQILAPLSMHQTQWNFEVINEAAQATTYFQNQLKVPAYQSNLYPSGGLQSSLSDLSLYLMEVLKNHDGSNILLPAAAFQTMIKPQLSPNQSPLSDTKNQGLMWELNGQQAGHNGGNYGVTLFMSFDKEKGYGRIFMTNISSYKDQQLIPQMVDIWKLLGKEGDRLSK